MPRLTCDPFNYAPYVVQRKFKSELLGGQNSLDQNISMLSKSQFWIKWLMWAGASSCWKTYSLPDATVSIHASLHPSERATIGSIELSHPKSLEPFQRLRESSQYVLSSDSSSLVYWNLNWTVLKPYILPQRHKRLILGIQKKTKLFSLLSAQREDLRWSRLFDYTTHLVSTSRLFWEYDRLEASDFLAHQQLWRRHNTAENLNLSGFWWRILYLTFDYSNESLFGLEMKIFEWFYKVITKLKIREVRKLSGKLKIVRNVKKFCKIFWKIEILGLKKIYTQN